jgi:DNA gyrase inhibitor GyrI
VTTSEYWVCVQMREGDDPGALGLGLEEGTLPGGQYARERLEGDAPAVYGLIKPTFDRLAEQRSDEDVSRPSIEFYRRNDVIDLLLPVS